MMDEVAIRNRDLGENEFLNLYTPYPGESESFWSRVKKTTPTGCWPWLGYIGAQGYGNLRFNGTQMRSNQVAWMLHNKRIIPAKGRLMLSCGNKQCCNPAHIFLGTTCWDAEGKRWVKISKENKK